MKILIFYATYGGGHLSVANAMKEIIEKEHPEIEVEMIDCMKYINKVINMVTTKAYSDMAKKVPWAWGKVYTHSNKGVMSGVTKTSNKLFALKLNSLIKKINPDMIISTHPFATQMCAFLKKHKKIDKKIVNILTDFEIHEQWLVRHEYIDYFFVANEHMKEELIEHGISKEKIFAEGIPISQKFSIKYDRKCSLEEFNLKENKKTILFFAGGKFGLAKNSVSDVIEIFARDFKDIQVIAISGKNEKLFNKFNEIVEKYKAQENIKVIEFTDKVAELMSISDIVITKPRRNHKF